MSEITLWVGPVSAQQTGGASWPGTTPTHWTCTGDGSPSCADLAALVMRGQRPWPSSPLWGAAFSAGGHFWRRVLERAEDRARLRGLYLADATYTTERRPDGSAAPIAGFVAWGLHAIERGVPWIATASSAPNKQHPTGAQTLWAIVEELDRVGVRWTDARALLPGSERAVQAGSVVLADYGSRYTHAEHATRLAPELLRRVGAELERDDDAPPNLNATLDPIRGTLTSGGGIVAAALVGGAAAASVWKRLRRRKERLQ